MFSYFKGILLAIIGKPIVITKVEKVFTPLNKEQIQKLEQFYPLPVYKQGASLLDIAYNTGKWEVVQFIKRWSANGGIDV